MERITLKKISFLLFRPVVLNFGRRWPLFRDSQKPVGSVYNIVSKFKGRQKSLDFGTVADYVNFILKIN